MKRSLTKEGLMPRPHSSNPEIATATVSQIPAVEPHSVEHEIHRHLMSHPSLRFSSLVIRRVPNGVLLEGFVETDAAAPDLCAFVKGLSGVPHVHNHLVVNCNAAMAELRATPPQKG